MPQKQPPARTAVSVPGVRVIVPSSVMMRAPRGRARGVGARRLSWEQRAVLAVALRLELGRRGRIAAPPSSCSSAGRRHPPARRRRRARGGCRRRLERTSVRFIQSVRSVFSVTASGAIGLVKLGHPVRLSYLSVDENSGWPETTST